MNMFRISGPRKIWIWATVLCGVCLLTSSAAWSQETSGDAGATVQAVDDGSAASSATDTAPTEPTGKSVAVPETPPLEADTAPPTSPPATEAAEAPAVTDEAATAADGKAVVEATDQVAAPGQPAIGQAPAGTDTAAATSTRTSPWLLTVLVAALFILPILIGNYLAQLWKMPDHSWKFSLTIFSLAASILIISFGEFKFGPDLAGGITLVYELADNKTADTKSGGKDSAATGRESDAFSMTELVDALKVRIDPTGTREVTIRPYGQAVEVIIPQQGQEELDYIKRKITDVGQLEFRITADSSIADPDRKIIALAQAAPPSQKIIRDAAGNPIAEWVNFSVEEFGPVDDPTYRNMVKRMVGDVPEALVLIDPFNVTGEYLTAATMGVDQRGGPAVNFAFDRRGAALFERLTSKYKPNPATGAVHYLGIMLDKRLISAPSIRETISNQGQISGGAMTQKEVEHIIGILKAGRLPAALNKTPISEEIISPTLGKLTIESGKRAILVSMIAVLAFMLIYYRFAGFVACLALSFNLLLVLALMVLIKGAFTLPGLAGLVLTIGMAVDANILIYERIREELKVGTALRMAIRNGFDRAMSAIIDSNVTTIISGVALYAIGTDQVKGFAVTLILGILTSMFTAIFFARIVFDVAERRGWISELRMMKLLSKPNYDFLGVRWPAIIASLVLIALGLVAAAKRGSQLFDIDFTGGTSVTFTLREPTPIGDVRDALAETELHDKNLLVVERGETQTRYTIDTSEQSVDAVKDVLIRTFGDRLMTYAMQFGDIHPFTEGEHSGTEATLTVNEGPGFADDDGVSYEALRDRLRSVLAAIGQHGVEPMLTNPDYRPGSSARFKTWTVRMDGVDANTAERVFAQLQTDMGGTPMFPLANKIGGRVSDDMKSKALWAVVVSLIGVVAYLWLRFQKASYGLAAAIAVAHDVLVTIGFLALSAYIVSWVPALARTLQIDAFQINLTIVAALLTIIGYSLNDTIVTFDRLREIKGKSPRLTPAMVNDSVNQCLSRTILTALTVFLTVVILYFFGGDGIHSFAFAFLVGVIAGTYSTVYIAAPMLLWLSGETIGNTAPPEPRTAERAG